LVLRRVQQADFTGAFGSWLADPTDRETALIRAAAHPDDLAHLDLGADSGQACAIAAYVGCKDVFRESTAIGVGTENSDRKPDLLTGLPTFTHVVCSRCESLRFDPNPR